MLWWGRFGLIVFLAAGCARHAVRPPIPAVRSQPAALAGVTLCVRGFAVEGLGPRDDGGALDSLRHAFVEHLQARTVFDRIEADAAAGAAGGPVLFADVVLRLARTTHRTYILDVLSLPVAGLLAPWWGRIDATIEVRLSDRTGEEVGRYEHATEPRFRSVWWSWYRRGFVEDAYARAYQTLFTAVARDVDAGRGALAERLGVPVDVAKSAAPLESRASGELALPPPAEERPEERMHLLRTRPTVAGGPWRAALAALGGVEASGIFGFARVASQVRDEEGRSIDIAAGDAIQTGYRVALYAAPRTTGFFVTPAIGYLRQEIEISDFRESLPESRVAGGEEVEARCTDLDTGAVIDCFAPNLYTLSMRSLYGGARAGYNLVAGKSSFVLFASASAGINLVERREIEARVAQYVGRRTRWDFVRSGAAGGTFGFELPKLHTALRLILDYEWYRRFVYADPLQFEGAVIFNEDKQKYERPLRYVSGASLSSWSLQCALAFLF